jgi:predicted metal-dependent hydrolase
MTNQTLTEIFRSTHRKYFSNRKRQVSAEFYPYRSLRHNIEWTTFHIRIKVSQYFRNAPVAVLEILALLLFAKLYRFNIDPELRKQYTAYANLLQKQLPSAKSRTLSHYSPRGAFYNLAPLFNRVNKQYFNGKLHVKHLGWSKQRSYRRLGFYDHKRDLLVISQIFDHAKVPEAVILYLLYHEMLHVLIPTVENKQRRKIHTTKFRQMEHDFPDYQRINQWIKKNLHKL